VPIVVLIDPNAGFPPLDIVRAGLGAERITDVATVATRILHDGSIEPVVPGTIPADAVVLDLDAFRRSAAVPAGTPLGPGVTLVRGPAVTALVTPGLLPRAPSAWVLAGLCLALLLILGAVGSGWVVGLTDLGWFGASALAPSFGLAVLGLIGTAASRLGVSLAGAEGIGLAVATSAAGWAVWAIGASLRRRPAVQTVDEPGSAAHAPNAAQNGSIPG
jgi:hypothetical protein